MRRPSSNLTARDRLHPVLIGCDETPGAEAAIALGRMLSRALDAKPLAVHVIPHPDYLLGDDAGLAFERRAQRVLRTAEDRLLGDGGSLRTVCSHTPAAGLLAAAEAEEAQVLVLGPVRRGPFLGIGGATTRALLTRATTTVAISSAGYEGPGPGPMRLLVRADGEAELTRALDLANQIGRSLDVVLTGPDALRDADARLHRSRQHSGSLTFDSGPSDEKQDLEIIGLRRRRLPLPWWPHTVTDSVIRRARCPVLLPRGPS